MRRDEVIRDREVAEQIDDSEGKGEGGDERTRGRKREGRGK